MWQEHHTQPTVPPEILAKIWPPFPATWVKWPIWYGNGKNFLKRFVFFCIGLVPIKIVSNAVLCDRQWKETCWICESENVWVNLNCLETLMLFFRMPISREADGVNQCFPPICLLIILIYVYLWPHITGYISRSWDCDVSDEVYIFQKQTKRKADNII